MSIRSRTWIAAALVGAVATACSGPVTSSPPPQRAMPVANPVMTIIAPVALTIEELPVTEPILTSGPMIVIERAHDPNRVATGATARVGATVKRELSRAGFSAAPRAQDQARDASFIVSPTVQTLTISATERSTTISCKVTLRIAPWSAVDQIERWEPHTTASATGEARATTSNARGQVELGIGDCLESAVRAAASREVIPFLRNVATE